MNQTTGDTSELGWGGGGTATHEPHEFTTNEILCAIGKEVSTIKSIAVFFLILTLVQGVLALLYVAGALG